MYSLHFLNDTMFYVGKTAILSLINLEEFKIIYYWEFIHRFLGRLIGLVYIFPLLYFTVKKKIKRAFICEISQSTRNIIWEPQLMFFLMLFLDRPGPFRF